MVVVHVPVRQLQEGRAKGRGLLPLDRQSNGEKWGVEKWGK